MNYSIGDIVKYKGDSNYLRKNNRDTNRQYVGNLGIITGINDIQGLVSYSLHAISKLPKSAWYDNSELELMDDVNDRLQRLI